MVREKWIRDDLPTRDPRLPQSIGALEALLNKVGALVSYRSKVLRSQVRTQRMLDLVTLHLRGADQVENYTRRLRAALEA